METSKNRRHMPLGNEHSMVQRRRAIDQLAIGSIIVLWGSLLTLKQAGLIEKTVSTWPFALTAFGILLLVSGIFRFSRSRHL